MSMSRQYLADVEVVVEGAIARNIHFRGTDPRCDHAGKASRIQYSAAGRGSRDGADLIRVLDEEIAAAVRSC
ncbi:MAG: hypothetical protein Q8P78_02415 [bacterium]|nr:hypothetical protein [bacterium]